MSYNEATGILTKIWLCQYEDTHPDQFGRQRPVIWTLESCLRKINMQGEHYMEEKWSWQWKNEQRIEQPVEQRIEQPAEQRIEQPAEHRAEQQRTN